MKYDYDVIVIGGGAGGLFAISVANALGAKTCLIEKKRLGGDCTWFGCMPSKAILKSASLVRLFKKSSSFGLGIDFKIDTSKVMDHVRDVVREISTHHPIEVFEKRGIKVIIGQPHFIDKGSLEVNDKIIRAKKFIICTGSHPALPSIEGLGGIDYLTNENVFDLKELPQSLIVLGGGPIGVELSQALSRLGVKVSIVEMADKLLFREEEEASLILTKVLKSEGLGIFTGKKAVKFSKKENKVFVTLEDKGGRKEEISAENVLVATGRAANLEGLCLQEAGVEYTNKGIKVNAYLRTKNPNIFACGDVIGHYMFSHVAAYQASVCVRNALFSEIIQGLLIAKSLKQPLAKIASVLFIYPTLSELIKKTAAKNLIEKAGNPFIKFALGVLKKI